jgi:hypothetical protein
MHQGKYTKDLLKKFGMGEANSFDVHVDHDSTGR